MSEELIREARAEIRLLVPCAWKCDWALEATHVNPQLCSTCQRSQALIGRFATALTAARAEGVAVTVPLIRLGLAALEACRDGCDYDGGDIQDDALTFGVVSKVEVGEGRYCSEGCRCEEYGADYCYRYTPETVRLRALAAALNITQGGERE